MKDKKTPPGTRRDELLHKASRDCPAPVDTKRLVELCWRERRPEGSMPATEGFWAAFTALSARPWLGLCTTAAGCVMLAGAVFWLLQFSGDVRQESWVNMIINWGIGAS